MRLENHQDQKFLKAVYERYGQELAVFIDQYHRAPGLGQDILHDVFVILAKKLPTLKDNTEPTSERIEAIRPYLYKVTRNLIMNMQSKRQRQKTDARESMDDVSHMTNSSSSFSQEYSQSQLVHVIISKLPPIYQDALILCDVQGLTANEASAILEISPNTISGRLRKARGIFRETYEQVAAGRVSFEMHQQPDEWLQERQSQYQSHNQTRGEACQ